MVYGAGTPFEHTAIDGSTSSGAWRVLGIIGHTGSANPPLSST
jgi:hypothetical protein